MTIEVSYEPRHIFEEKIKSKYKNIIYLDEYLIYFSGEQEENVLVDKEKNRGCRSFSSYVRRKFAIVISCI